MSELRILPFEIVLESGVVGHVADCAEALGYKVNNDGKSAASFSAAKGRRIENQGSDNFEFDYDQRPTDQV